MHPFFILPSGPFDLIICVAIVGLMAYFCYSAQFGSLKFASGVVGAVCGVFMWWGVNWALAAFIDPGDNPILAILELVLGCVIAFVAFGVAGMSVPNSKTRDKLKAEEEARLKEEREKFENMGR